MSELKNQNDLLQQLKTLQAEKELLEKHVFVLNECLSVEELKTKISNLEEKQEMLVRLENLIERLRTETEPLSYLKSILKNKVEMENQINSIESKPNINLKKNIPKFDMNYLNTSIADCKSIQPQSVQITSNNSFKTDLISSQKLNDQLLDTIQTPCDSNKGSIVNDGSLDECTSILDQYDVVTDLEMINFSEEVRKVKYFFKLKMIPNFYICRIIQKLKILISTQMKYKINKQLQQAHILMLKV